jgi:serine/threonine protein kinase
METNKVKKRLLFLPPSVVNNSERECAVSDFQSLSRKAIGEGAFGQVFKVRHISTSTLYAIKVVSKAKILERNMTEQLKREVRIMYSLNHPNIIKLHNHFEDDSNVYLIMELAEGGNLFQRLCKFRNFDERNAAQYLREVALAVQYLHSQDPPIIHRDIKPENIFLDATGRSKLGDFGWSSVYDSERCTYCGTLEYLAPEMIDRIGHGLKLDMWNLGVLLFEMLVGEAPFRSKSQTELFNKIKACKIGFPKNFSLNAKDLVRKLLKTTAEERINVNGLLEHPWMKENPPTRPTINVTTEIRPQPVILDSSVVHIPDAEYLVISEGSTRMKRVNDELKTKKELLDSLQQKIEKLSQQKAKNPSTIRTQLEKLQTDYQKEKTLKDKKTFEFVTANQKLQTQKNLLNGSKTFLKVMRWVSSKNRLQSLFSECKEVIAFSKESPMLPFAMAVAQNIREGLVLKPELEKIYNNTYLELERRNKEISALEQEIQEIKKVLELKRQICSMILKRE